MEKIIKVLEMGVISLSTLGTKGAMFAVWTSGSVQIYMSRFSWLVFNNINESTQIEVLENNTSETSENWDLKYNLAIIQKGLHYLPKGKALIGPTIGQINTQRFYTTSAVQPEIIKLDPWFVTGLSDGEGSFGVSIINSPASRVGFSVKPVFSIGLHTKDAAVLEQIKSLWGVGKIYYGHGPQTIQYRVESIKELQTVIKHFDKFPLITQKLADYLLFKEVVSIIERKEHLTQEGLEKIVGIKAAINRGLSDKLKVAFPDIIPVAKPLVELAPINAYWLAGFVSGEGSFGVQIYKAKTKLGEAVKVIFTITQHIRDEQLMLNLIKYLDCGNVTKRNREEAVDFKVIKFSDINNKIIPFFEKYPIQGVKSNDFKDYCK